MKTIIVALVDTTTAAAASLMYFILSIWYQGLRKCSAFCVSVSLTGESQDKGKSLASRLSQKVQASLDPDCEKDEDFRPDRKRIRSAEYKVVIVCCCLLDIYPEFIIYNIGPESGSPGPLYY